MTTTSKTAKLTKPQQSIIGANRPGETLTLLRQDVGVSLNALVRNGHLVLSAVNGSHVTYTVQDTPEVRATNAAYALIPLTDPTAPIPVSELDNFDESPADTGTLVDPEPENNLPDVQPEADDILRVRSIIEPKYGVVKSISKVADGYDVEFCEPTDSLTIAAIDEDTALQFERWIGNTVTFNLRPDVQPVKPSALPLKDDFTVARVRAELQRYGSLPAVRRIAAEFSAISVSFESPLTHSQWIDIFALFVLPGVDVKAEVGRNFAVLSLKLFDCDGKPLRVHDWVETMVDHPYPIRKGSQGGVIGIKSNGLIVVGFPDRVANDELAHFPEYRPADLKRIDPPAPNPDPIDYDAYNGGLADAALNALVEADIKRAEQKPDPHAWATIERHIEVNALLEKHKVYPLELHPSSDEGVWLIEDEWTVKTMRRTLDKLGVEIVGELAQDWNGDEPYCVARFRLPDPTYQPYPSKRQTKPTPDYPSIFTQYDSLRETLNSTTRLLIQVNGDEWAAYHMTAMLTKQYLPGAKLERQTVNQKGEQWDKLTVPADQLNALIALANADGVTVALASIVKDEPGKLPERAVTEIFYANGSAERIDITDDETTPDEAEGESAPVTEPAPVPAPKLELTPERQAAIIKRHIAGGLRLGLVLSVRCEASGDYWVEFVNPATTFTRIALETEYQVVSFFVGSRGVLIRPKSAPPVPDVQAQADAVIAALPEPDEQPAEPEARAVELLSFEAETTLIKTLANEHADLYTVCSGPTEFFLNVIARMRAAALVVVSEPF